MSNQDLLNSGIEKAHSAFDIIISEFDKSLVSHIGRAINSPKDIDNWTREWLDEEKKFFSDADLQNKCKVIEDECIKGIDAIEKVATKLNYAVTSMNELTELMLQVKKRACEISGLTDKIYRKMKFLEKENNPGWKEKADEKLKELHNIMSSLEELQPNFAGLRDILGKEIDTVAEVFLKSSQGDDIKLEQDKENVISFIDTVYKDVRESFAEQKKGVAILVEYFDDFAAKCQQFSLIIDKILNLSKNILDESLEYVDNW